MNHIKQKHIQELKHKLNAAHMLRKLILLQRDAHTIPGYFLGSVLTTLKWQLEPNVADAKAAAEGQLQDIQQHMYQVIDTVHHEESYISFLSTSAAVAPLLGLFGTVWGLVHAFIGISEKQPADIAAVARGLRRH